jgi:soluble lytic murein transglycosylase
MSARIFHACLPLLFAAMMMVKPALAATAKKPSNGAAEISLQALQAVRAGHAQDALTLAAKSNDPVVKDLVAWLLVKKDATAMNFAALSKLVASHPSWPHQGTLKRRLESSLNDSVPRKTVSAWFGQHAPTTSKGKYYALKALHNPACTDCNQQAKKAWQRTEFSKEDESLFLKEFGHYLTKKDHDLRMEHLICAHSGSADAGAARMLSKVSEPQKALYHAHQALRSGKRASGKLPDHPCILFDQAQLYLKNKNEEAAAPLLHKLASKYTAIGHWWKSKNLIVRSEIKAKNYSSAYRLAASHGHENGTDFAEGEWLAGWIALRFLKNPQKAEEHFERLYANAKYAVTRARGAYWAARTAKLLKKDELARTWYQKAMVYPDTFYGQMALNEGPALGKMPAITRPKVTDADTKQYHARSINRAAYLLFKAGWIDEALAFTRTALASAKSDGERTLIAEMPSAMGRSQQAVLVAKEAGYYGVLLPAISYPTLTIEKHKPLDETLTHAIIRQESNFDRHAISNMGARGLMQLMPDTAKLMAKKVSAAFHLNKLHDSHYNIKLGVHYFHSLLENFDGSTVLAVAAYNAGPGNARKWVQCYGDPRQMKTSAEVVDWIESIPFSQTRDYVQRVLSNAEMYRLLRHKKGAYTLALNRELMKGQSESMRAGAVPQMASAR